MKKKLKATLEKALEQLLQNTLENTYNCMDKEILNLVNSKRDFLFGVVVGDMLEGLGFCIYGAFKRSPKDKEFKELYQIVEERSERILKKIDAMLSE